MNLSAKDKEKILNLYEGRFSRLGYDVRTIGWGDAESQILRFNILADIADLSGCSVCDLGCGFGDMYPYLLRRFNKVNYCGIDISEKLIAKARTLYPSAKFEVCDILENSCFPKYDYILSSGALSLKLDDHDRYIERMIRRMMEMSIKGVAVNFLSSYVDYQEDKNYHLSPANAIELGRRLTRYVTLRHDYPLYEFTLYLYHGQ